MVVSSEGRHAALVLACDLSKDGLSLGWHTIKRLEAGMAWQKRTKGVLVVAAARSPYHPGQPASIAELMAVWLQKQGITEVVILRARSFNTRGELSAFIAEPCKTRTIISAWWHVPRVKLIVWQMFGSKTKRSVVFTSVWKDMPTIKQMILEPVKYIHVGLPARWRDRAKQLWEKIFGRAAW